MWGVGCGVWGVGCGVKGGWGLQVTFCYDMDCKWPACRWNASICLCQANIAYLIYAIGSEKGWVGLG